MGSMRILDTEQIEGGDEGGTNLGEQTRRTVLRGTVATLGIGVTTGVGSAHDWSDAGGNSKFVASDDDDRASDDDPEPETRGKSKNATRVGYHSLGDVGTESESGQPEDPHQGGLTEIRVQTNEDLDRDFAYVGVFSSSDDSGNRGMAIIDVTEYTRAEGSGDLEDAEMEVVSFLPNNNTGTAIMDVKPNESGDFVFLGTQPISLLYDDVSTSEPEDDLGTGTNTGGLIAVDVSDPENPKAVASISNEIFTTGIHNLFSHRIDGEDYVFANKDIDQDSIAGLYVYKLDRSLAEPTLEPINYYNVNGDYGREQAAAPTPVPGGDHYCHDNEVIDDPRTGIPTLYLAYWDQGVHTLDVSDPSDIEKIGQFDMKQAHFVTPAPELVPLRDADGNVIEDEHGDSVKKRVVVASHEEPSSDYDDGDEEKTNPDSTGTVFLIDADGIHETERSTEMGELANWTWYDDPDMEFENFELSPHNSDVSKHTVKPGGKIDEQFWIHQGHYYAGVQFLRIRAGEDDGTTGGFDRDHDATDWSITEEGFSRPVEEDLEEDSGLEGLTGVTPDIWAAVELNGVTFLSDINQGVHAIHYDDFPVGSETVSTGN